MFLKASFSGDANIGLHGFASDKYAFLGMKTKLDAKIEEALSVKAAHSSMLYTPFAGIFCAGNSHGVVVPKIMKEYEFHEIKRVFDNVLVLDTDYSAIGNLILLNDKGVILSPFLQKHKKEVADFFNLPVEVTKIGGTNVVGSIAVATNKGCLAGPLIKENEISLLEDVLKVQLGVGTVSFGSNFVRSGIITNSNGFIMSDTSSGPEMGRASEALGFV